jgi:P27 family predicted phage terminase small subunit
MGARGPKPLPANVLALRGSWRAQDRQDQQVQPEIEIPDCPKHLLPEARKFWRRLTPELEKLGLISKIDQAALALACQEWAWLVWHEMALQRDIRIAEEKRAAAELAAAAKNEAFVWTGGDGFQVPTPNGNLTYSPHWVARNRHALLLDKFLASFGMSPSSRGRVTPSSRQLELPGVEPKEGFAAL